MKFPLFEKVALKDDIPEYGLKKGSVGTVVEHYPMPEGQEDGYSLEGLIWQDTVEVAESRLEEVELPKTSRVFISHRNRDPDNQIAHEIFQVLNQKQHEIFLDVESLRLGENWSKRIDQELQRCDCLILLLSQEAAESPMVIQEVSAVGQRRRRDPSGTYPAILPIVVKPEQEASFSLGQAGYHLRGYLGEIQYEEWKSHQDTPRILDVIMASLNVNLPVAEGLNSSETVLSVVSVTRSVVGTDKRMSRSQRLELDRLRSQLQDQERDYKTVERDLRVELDGPTRNKLEDRLTMIVEEIDDLEEQVRAVEQGDAQ